jgi:hypothetical protein
MREISSSSRPGGTPRNDNLNVTYFVLSPVNDLNKGIFCENKYGFVLVIEAPTVTPAPYQVWDKLQPGSRKASKDWIPASAGMTSALKK